MLKRSWTDVIGFAVLVLAILFFLVISDEKWSANLGRLFHGGCP